MTKEDVDPIEGEDDDVEIDDDDADDTEAPVLEDDDFDDPDEDDEEDKLAPKPLRPAPKRSTLRGSNAVGGVPRAKLDDPKVAAEVWTKLRDGVGNIAPLDYAISATFKPDDIISHPKFGVGFVIAVPGGTKVEILFSDQVRKLVQGR